VLDVLPLFLAEVVVAITIVVRSIASRRACLAVSIVPYDVKRRWIMLAQLRRRYVELASFIGDKEVSLSLLGVAKARVVKKDVSDAISSGDEHVIT
jgi:hypothetical protein